MVPLHQGMFQLFQGGEPHCWASPLWLAMKVVVKRTASLENVLDIHEKHLSSKDEGPEVLSFAAIGQNGNFMLFWYPTYCNVLMLKIFYIV